MPVTASHDRGVGVMISAPHPLSISPCRSLLCERERESVCFTIRFHCVLARRVVFLRSFERVNKVSLLVNPEPLAFLTQPPLLSTAAAAALAVIYGDRDVDSTGAILFVHLKHTHTSHVSP